MTGGAYWIALGVLTAATPGALAAQEDSVLVAEVAALARGRAAADSFSGVVLLARGDRQLLLLPLGYRDREQRLPNEGNTKFAIASMTKMFTGVAVGQLVQQGRLRFTDTVRMLAPALPAALAERLTVHQLLTHTSGLGSIWGEEFRRRGGDAFHSPRDFYPLFTNRPLEFEPGSRWGYSNAGYVVLGDLIERVSGEAGAPRRAVTGPGIGVLRGASPEPAIRPRTRSRRGGPGTAAPAPGRAGRGSQRPSQDSSSGSPGTSQSRWRDGWLAQQRPRPVRGRRARSRAMPAFSA